MKVEMDKRVHKDLKKLPHQVSSKIQDKIDELKAADTFDTTKTNGKLAGTKDRYKIRIGSYRIVLKKETNTHVKITAIANRKDIYNHLFSVIMA